jgi:hypothetical protein
MIATAVGGIPEIFGIGSPALIEPDAVELAGKISEAVGGLAVYHGKMPALTDLKGRFGANVMAAEIEKAYFLALRNNRAIAATS